MAPRGRGRGPGNAGHESFLPDRSTVEGVPFAPLLAVGGRWVGEWIDPWSGASLGAVDVVGGPGGTAELPVPSFSRDVALRPDPAPKEAP